MHELLSFDFDQFCLWLVEKVAFFRPFTELSKANESKSNALQHFFPDNYFELDLNFNLKSIRNKKWNENF